MVTFRMLLMGMICLLVGCAVSDFRLGGKRHALISFEAPVPDPVLAQRVLALDPDQISAEDVRTVLSKCAAPRIMNFRGSAFNTIDDFSRFLVAMGYPERSVRDPASRALSYSSDQSSDAVAHTIVATWRREVLRPMLIGHSQGGSLIMKVLHQLDGQPVSYAAAIATGQFMRMVRGQWDRLPILRKVPDTVAEFSGYRLAGDIIGGDVTILPKHWGYKAEGFAQVHNVRLNEAGHRDIMRIQSLAHNAATRARIDGYFLGSQVPEDAKLHFAADIWYHVKKRWCMELQGYVRDHRQAPSAAIAP